MQIFELTRRLIEIPSISGDEKAVAEFLADYLSRAGFAVELREAEPQRPNVYARHGEPEVVMSSHTDTVPPYVEFREDDEAIYGRGARDANLISNRSRFLINGEPTESKLALGSKGALRALLRTTGRAAHSAYPQ